METYGFDSQLGTVGTAAGYPYGEASDEFATYRKDSAAGLHYAWNRNYSATWERFASADPFQTSVGAASPQPWSRYAYVDNDPVNFQDARGLEKDGVWFKRKVNTGSIRFDAAAIAVPVEGITTGARVRALTANITLQSNPLGANLAGVLLHERGHVSDIVATLGGSAIRLDTNPDGAPNEKIQKESSNRISNYRPRL